MSRARGSRPLLSRWFVAATSCGLACSSPVEQELKEPVEEDTPARARLESSEFDVSVLQVGQSRLLSLDGESSEGSLTWEGRAKLTRAVDDPEVELLQFSSQQKGSVTIGGQEASGADVSTLPPVAFRRAENGAIAKLNFEEDHDQFFQNLAQTLLAHAFPHCRKKRSGMWRSIGRDLQGTFVMENRLVSSVDQLDEWAWTRSLERYDDLIGWDGPMSDLAQDTGGRLQVSCDARGLKESEGSIRFSATKDGVEMHGFELSLDVKRSSLETHESTEEEQARLLDALEHVDFEEGGTLVGGIYETERMRRNVLEAKMEGIEVSDVVGYSAMFETLGRRPEHLRTFKRAVALVQFDDTAAKAIADASLEPNAGSVAMAFLLDVLAGAETVAAQDQLLRVLRSEKIRDAPELIQAGALRRLAFIVRPTRDAVAHALGAC